jgi:hypothetical protein
MINRLSQVHIRNFRAISGPVDIDLAPITILYGPNSAGKSAVYAVIDLVGRLCSHGDATFEDNEDLLRAMRNHDYTRTMTIGLAGHFCELPSPKANGPDHITELARNLEENLPRLAWYLLRKNQYKVQYLDIRVMFSVDYQGRRWDSGKPYPFFDPSGNRRPEIYGPRAFPIEIYLGDRLLVTITFDKLTFDLSHPVIELANLDLNDYGHTFPSLALRVMQEDSEAISVVENMLCVSIEHYFYDGVLEISSGYAQETTDTTQVLVVLLRTLLRGLIMLPFHYISSAASEFTHIGPVRKIPTDKELTFFSRNLFGDCFEVYADFGNSAWSWKDGGEAWKELAASGSYGLGMLQFVPHRPLMDCVNDWLNGPQRLNLKHRLHASHSSVNESSRMQSRPTAANGNSRPVSTVPDRITFISLGEDEMNESVSVSDVGAGIPHLVPVLTAGFLKTQVFVEQPELHLHPSLQTEIADFFISRYNISETSFVIESHSECLALRLLRRIRETSTADIKHREFQLTANQVAFYYFNPTSDGTNVVRLRVSDQGEFLDRWPRGFFAEREAELFGEDD